VTITHLGRVFCILAACVTGPAIASGSAVQALFDLSKEQTSPFPSNRFTAFEPRNQTYLRVNLPKPDCATQPSDCADVAAINTLDGFNLQPRLRIPFSGPIDPASVDASNVFLVNLDEHFGHRGRQSIVGINQVVWDPATFTLFAESDELLDQHTTYALIVTDGVRDTHGKRVQGDGFSDFIASKRRSGDVSLSIYRFALLDALSRTKQPLRGIVAASVFTTQSATADLEKIRRQIDKAPPSVANFELGSDGSRSVYTLDSLTGIELHRQVGTVPTYTDSAVPLAALRVLPNAPSVVGKIAFGRYSSPDYRNDQLVIPPAFTRNDAPRVRKKSDVYFDLYLPAGSKPASGWPTAIYGHGFTDSKQGSPLTLAASLAARGIATLAINVVGHGGGALGTMTINTTSGNSVVIPAGGRGSDQNGDGAIDSTEGVEALPAGNIVNTRDGLRQTVIDLMQLVQLIESGGIDVDGDGAYDLDRERIYYFGQSFGSIYGPMLLAVEPGIRAGVTNVGGGPLVDVARLGGFRGSLGLTLATRVPPLLNTPPLAPPLFGFTENLPLRDQPVLTNTVPGAIKIQDFIDRSEWVAQSGNPLAYAPHIRKEPLRGLVPKPIIVQFAKGDATVANPTNSSLIRAGELTDYTTYYRNDLAFAANPAVPKNPHTFLTNIGSAVTAPMALAAQAQIAIFFASDGATVIDPDGAGPLFETPIAGPLPEELNFIP